MIPSRTVFNHRKWIYIELAITRAHSGHGPLVYQPPSAYQCRASSNVFPISSLGASEPTLLLPLLSSLLAYFPTRILSLEALLPIPSLLFDLSYVFPVHLSFILFHAGYIFLPLFAPVFLFPPYTSAVVCPLSGDAVQWIP